MQYDKIAASEEMRQGFAFEQMEPPRRAREWFEDLFRRHPFTSEACEFFRTLRLEVGDLSREWGGGFWWGDRNLVQVRGCQDEAALHELAHAFWHTRRTRGDAARDLMESISRLAEESDPRYRHAATLAGHYVHGIPTQPDPNSPTGYWRGMLVDENDWEMFAGLASGIKGDLRQLPPYVRRFYRGLFVDSEEVAEPTET